MIVCDTREKKNSHILDYFDKYNIPYVIQKLDTGDYMDADRPAVTVDRKQNLDELCQNLCTKDNSRFWREVRRSKDEDIKLVVLIEQGDIKRLPEVRFWKSEYHSQVSGRRLYNEACRCHIAYGVEFLFCDKAETGQRIIEILGGDW